MSQLIHIRQRIKAIKTIKKITHAMRLIAMSSHSRLSKKQKTLSYYQNTIATLFQKVQSTSNDWHNPIMQPTQPLSYKPLIILVGSHKGLCGTFNSGLFSYTKQFLKTNYYLNPLFFCIGSKAIDFITTHYAQYAYKPFIECTSRTFLAIARAITNEIFTTPEPYSAIIVISNKMKTFFIQKPDHTFLIPFTSSDMPTFSLEEEYTWEEEPSKILNHIASMYIESKLQYLLFESMQAEHAARFISMDSSTRNADTILESTRLMYNKLRQAKITKELTELSGSF